MMKQDISFIIATDSYIVSRGLAELLSQEFGNVRLIDNIEEIEDIVPPTSQSRIVLLCDEYIISKSKPFLLSLSHDINILPIHISANKMKDQQAEIPYIHISFSKSLIVKAINDLLSSTLPKLKKEVKHQSLTRRETAVLRLVARGFTTKQIADRLSISTQTVSTHRKTIIAKLQIKSIPGLTAYAILNGLVEIQESNLK